MNRRKAEEIFFKVLMIGSTTAVLGSLVLILATVVWRGLPALTLDMLTQTPKGGYYLGKEGGILNAIVGSLCLGRMPCVRQVGSRQYQIRRRIVRRMIPHQPAPVAPCNRRQFVLGMRMPFERELTQLPHKTTKRRFRLSNNYLTLQ